MVKLGNGFVLMGAVVSMSVVSSQEPSMLDISKPFGGLDGMASLGAMESIGADSLPTDGKCTLWSTTPSYRFLMSQTTSMLNQSVFQNNPQLAAFAPMLVGGLGSPPREADQCIGRINATKLMQLISEIFQEDECKAFVRNPDKKGESLDIFTAVQTKFNSKSTEEYCQNFGDFLSCANEVIPVIMDYLHTSTAGCCDDFIKTYLSGSNPNDSINDLLYKMLEAAGNMACAKIKLGKREMYCSETRFLSMEFSELTKLFQIPNKQGCNAMSGKKFLLTSGETSAPLSSSADCCSTYYDDFLMSFSSLAYIRKGLGSKVFDGSSCMTLPPQIGLLFSLFVQQPAPCIHIPVNFSKGCAFKNTCTARFT